MKTRDFNVNYFIKDTKKEKKFLKQEKNCVEKKSPKPKRALYARKSGNGTKEKNPKREAEVKRKSGVDAVKLYLQTTGGTGRTSRSATAVRKTSIRMAAIKEYPFDLSDIRNSHAESDKQNIQNQTASEKNAFSTPSSNPPAQEPPPVSSQRSSVAASVDGKRKVSIMVDETRENESRNGRITSHAHSEGPVRKKSNLAHHNDGDSSWDRSHIEGRYKKYSTTSSIYSKKALSHQSEHIERSWWYACCAKCHQEDAGIPSWEPPHWQKICPYPLCPSYRHFAQTLSVFIIGIMVWVIVWLIMGPTAAPGGQLFMLAALTIVSHFGGWLLTKTTTLPSLIGMLIVGIIMKNIHFVNFESDYLKVCSFIRKIALTIILTRAGLDLDPMAMKKIFLTVIKLAMVPWTFEFVLCAVMANLLLELPWDWAFLLGAIVAAVSPAVVVPCLFRLREKGYGVSKGIPTLVLAVSGIDDAASVAVFGIVFGIMFSSASLTMNIVKGPCSVVGGIVLGCLMGYAAKYVPERNDAFLVPLRVLFLLFGGIVLILGSEEIGWGGAGPLAVIAFAFFACKHWAELGWNVEDNPVATAFEIFWMFFEPMLFAITGAQVVIEELDPHLVLVACGILITCMVLRAVVTSLSAVRSNLNTKEKIFVGLAWMAKATVQAALGPVALDEIRKLANGGEVDPVLSSYAETVVTVCIMSIVLTAPLGAIVITLTGPRLLTKTTKPPVLEGWRRSHRPSIRDISIIDEEEIAERDAEDDVTPRDLSGHSPIPDTYTTPIPITVQPNHRT